MDKDKKMLNDDMDVYRDIFDNADEILFTHDLDGTFIETNRCTNDILGCSRNELKNKNVRDFIPDKYKDKFDDYIARLKDNSYDSGVWSVVTANGNKLYFEYKNSLVCGPEGPKYVRCICRNITEQLKFQKALESSEKNLKESEQKYRDIFENINEGIYLHDMEGYFIDINPYFIKNIGYSKQELLTKNVKDLIPEQQRHEFNDYLERIKVKGFEKGLLKAVNKQGQTHIVEYTNSLVRGENGPVAVRGVARDVTEQLNMQKAFKKSQNELKASEQKYRDIFENINAYIYIHDLNGNYIETNSYFIKNIGYSKRELQAKNISDLIPEKDKPGYEEYLKRILFNGSDTGVFKVITKDGLIRVIEYTNSMIQRENGPMAIRGLALDITEKFNIQKALKKSERKLKENEQKFRDIFENIDEYIYLTDMQGNYIDTNPHFIKNMGYSRGELLTKNVRDLMPEKYKPEFKKYLKRIKANGFDKGLLNVITKDGHTRVVHYTNSLVKGKHGPIAIRGVARDITDEFKARNTLQKSEEALRIARDHLEKSVQERTLELKKSNKMLKEKSRSLEEANIALRVLLSKKDEAQKEVEERMFVNIRDLIVPALNKMRLSRLTDTQKAYADLIESNLNHIMTPFSINIFSKYHKLSPTEIQIATLIREGKTTKEIAAMLSLAPSTIHTHRDSIRKKLQIKNKKLNLIAHLIAMDK